MIEVEKQPSISYTLPGAIMRKDFSRSEIMGRLGMIPLKTKNRFDLDYAQKNPKFLEDIQRIYDAKADSIMTIYCSREEYEQFDLR